MKTALLASLLALSSSLVGAGCGGTGDNSPMPDLGGPTGMTVAELAIATPQLSTLVSALQKASLVDTLKGPGPFTVFAPTNDAFAALKSAGVDAAALDVATLTAVLQYHVVAGKDLAADVVTKKTLTTLGGAVNVDVRGSMVYLNGLTLITKTDIVASNGVVHLVDSVLLPDTSVLDLVGIATAYPSLSSLQAAVVQANLASALQAAGPFTLFAPVNSAFAALPAAPSPSQLPSILQYHVLSGAVTAAIAVSVAGMAPPGNKVPTLLSGKSVTLTTTANGLAVDGANVIYTDIKAKNGIVHLLDAVLLPM